jgi:MFS family permease
MRLIISFAALFLSVILLQFGVGTLAPLDVLSGTALGFTKTEIGMLGSAHFLGFFIGCWWAPRLMGTIGHSRAFAAFMAAGTIGILGHMMVLDPYAWGLMRMTAGMCVAGCYTIIEAWLQSKVTNENRGRAMGSYRVVDIAGSLAAQLLVGVLEPASYMAYNLLAILCYAALLPITLTRAEAPQTPQAPRLRPALAWQRSPLAAAGVVVAGVTGAAFRMVGPIYGLEVGLKADQVALFLAAYVLGGAVAQIPVGWLADRIDRRSVLVGMSILGALSCLGTALSPMGGMTAIFAASAFFGLATMPIYSTPMERVELSAALMFLYAVGAIASPLLASLLTETFGPAAMFAMIAFAHLALVVFGFVRMGARAAPGPRTAYTYEPRTSFLIGRLLGRSRDR